MIALLFFSKTLLHFVSVHKSLWQQPRDIIVLDTRNTPSSPFVCIGLFQLG